MNVTDQETTPLEGIRYYDTAQAVTLEGRDGNAAVRLGAFPIPLQEEEYPAEGELPSFDAVGRGLYRALRIDPDCRNAVAYASILADSYPHLLAELAAQVVMLEHKEVDTPYLDRKINGLRILAHVQPQNARLPLEIGRGYREKGLRFQSMHVVTRSLYEAEKHFRIALELSRNAETLLELADVVYLLGRYAEAAVLWEEAAGELPPEQGKLLLAKSERAKQGPHPMVPPVDYLEAVSIAMEQCQEGDPEEGAAIVTDILADEVFTAEFPSGAIHYVLGACYDKMNMPERAEAAWREALRLEPGLREAHAALEDL